MKDYDIFIMEWSVVIIVCLASVMLSRVCMAGAFQGWFVRGGRVQAGKKCVYRYILHTF